MKETGVLFSGPLVRSILAGQKTQTRRPIKFRVGPGGTKLVRIPNRNACIKLTDVGLVWNPYSGCPDTPWVDGQHDGMVACPFGQAGDRLWVRETWKFLGTDMNRLGRTHMMQDGVFEYRADGQRVTICRPHQDIERYMIGHTKWRPSIHMPRWASRITLDVVNVRVERLQDISEADAKLEGMPGLEPHQSYAGFLGPYREQFRGDWDAIYANRGLGWNANPWVWAVDFRMVTP
jgi:hypothetical protein